MDVTLTTAVERLGRCRHIVDESLRQADAEEDRVARLAQNLHATWPNLPLYACVLGDRAAVLDGRGQTQAAWMTRLQKEWNAIRDGAAAPNASAALLPDVPQLAGLDRLVAPVLIEDRCRGMLAVATSPATSEETRAVLRCLLDDCAAHLAARLRLEALAWRCRDLEQELAAQTNKADMGEVAGPIAHEFNNWLNTLLLHVAVLEREIPEEARGELQHIRQQSRNLASLIKEWQRYRQGQQPQYQAIDLNELIRDTVAAPGNDAPGRRDPVRWPSSSPAVDDHVGSATVRLALDSGLPRVLGPIVELKRLVRFLINQAVALSTTGAKGVTVRTAAADNQVLLRLENAQTTATVDDLMQMIDLSGPASPDGQRLELAAAETLLCRMQGRLRVEAGAQGGVVFVVELPAALTAP